MVYTGFNRDKLLFELFSSMMDVSFMYDQNFMTQCLSFEWINLKKKKFLSYFFPVAFGGICDTSGTEMECEGTSECLDDGDDKSCQCQNPTSLEWSTVHKRCVNKESKLNNKTQ